VMIALKAGFSFVEFLRWSAPIAVVVNIVTYAICRWWFAESVVAFEQAVAAEHDRKHDRAAHLERISAREQAVAAVSGGGAADIDPDTIDYTPEEDNDDNPLGHSFYEAESVSGNMAMGARRTRQISWGIFILTILLLVTHGQSEKLLGRLFGAPGGHLGEGTMMVGHRC